MCQYGDGRLMKNLDKLLSWLQTSEYDGVILGRRDNFKWITEENANAVVTNAEVGVSQTKRY